MRVTVLRAANGERIQIPNQQVYTSAIVDRSSYPSRRFLSIAKIADGVDIKGLLGRGMAELRRVDGIEADPSPRVALVPRFDVGPSIEATYWVDYHDVDPLRVKGEVDARLAHLAAGSTFDRDAVDSGAGKATGQEPENKE